ncbi:esterase-like activity of phytase family protein [Mesohalobacter halotolerans]|uniref:Esterase-like activity of phytase family protein n=1 Tax=Mesohalobacter halotolerans TaxID=1883405 RepID=A0A4U5TPR2_9FLAO|nr:esterase-like activity of phytase family protein [Mesohalobacter halotolerans]MBS3739334.1 esterase-like activity of phytase family protein [Psychroflexus sp.]TKS56140.1 esterase-like activity of phytase family protein [Mesohalobacter halotolerans]
MRSKQYTKSYNIIILNIVAFFVGLLLMGCKTTKLDVSAPYQVKFLDEFILTQKSFKKIEVGGLSGIDYNGEYFVLISDKSKNPDIFKADIKIDKQKFQYVKFIDAKVLKCEGLNRFDPESIRFLPDHSGYLISTEGYINSNENAQILKVDEQGQCHKNYELPQYFDVNYPNRPRHNAVFEGLTIDSEKTGFWVINEIPLEEDGKKPKLYNTQSLLRLTHFNFEDHTADRQFAYDLERLVRIPLLPFGLNGATELLQLDKNHIIIIERSYSAGHGSKGNRIKMFLVEISSAENILEKQILKKYKGKTLPKTLIFDSKTIKNDLQYKFIDNIEGISFGPNLPNGNKSLILVSDNNFNAIGKQLNQFILLELIKSYR